MRILLNCRDNAQSDQVEAVKSIFKLDVVSVKIKNLVRIRRNR